MNSSVSRGPHRKEVFPDCGDDVGCPEDSGVTVGSDLELAEVLILEARPFQGHSTLEDLPPTERGLFIDETVKYDRVLEFF